MGNNQKDTCLSTTSEQFIKRVLGNIKHLSMYSQWVGYIYQDIITLILNGFNKFLGMITMIRKRLGHIRDVNITRQRYNLAHDFPWNCVSTMSFMKWLIGLRYERNKMYASSIFYTLHFWEADSTNVMICKIKCKTMITS